MDKETRKKIIALYFGQKIGLDAWNVFSDPAMVNGDFMEYVDFAKTTSSVLVTPISKITDEDAIEVAKMCPSFNQTGKYEVYKNHFQQTIISSNKNEVKYHKFLLEMEVLNHQQIDYLRSKGYALPYLNYSVEELVKECVFTLKN